MSSNQQLSGQPVVIVHKRVDYKVDMYGISRDTLLKFILHTAAVQHIYRLVCC